MDSELRGKMEEEWREIARQAREYAKKTFPERGLAGDPRGWIDDAVKILEIYADYLKKFELHAHRDIEKVEEVADLLYWWGRDLDDL